MEHDIGLVMSAERRIENVIHMLDSAIYQTSYETRMCNELKRAINDLAQSINASAPYLIED